MLIPRTLNNSDSKIYGRALLAQRELAVAEGLLNNLERNKDAKRPCSEAA